MLRIRKFPGPRAETNVKFGLCYSNGSTLRTYYEIHNEYWRVWSFWVEFVLVNDCDQNVLQIVLKTFDSKTRRIFITV